MVVSKRQLVRQSLDQMITLGNIDGPVIGHEPFHDTLPGSGVNQFWIHSEVVTRDAYNCYERRRQQNN